MAEMPEGLQGDFSRDALLGDHMRALYDFWCEARGSARIPPASAIDPMRLPRNCLPHLSVLEVEQAPFRLRSRLSGTALVEQFGHDPTGRYLDELPAIAAQLARMEWCVREQRPYLAEAVLSFAPKNFKRYQILVLPFGDPETGVTRLVGGFSFPDDTKTPRSWAS